MCNLTITERCTAEQFGLAKCVEVLMKMTLLAPVCFGQKVREGGGLNFQVILIEIQYFHNWSEWVMISR